MNELNYFAARRQIAQAMDEAHENARQSAYVGFCCDFAAAGTYGHECGRPAVLAASKPSQRTLSGRYWVHRCAECAAIVGGENAALSPFVDFHPGTHRNVWR